MSAPDLELPGFAAQDGVELLQKAPLFRWLTWDETRRLLEIARPERRRAGEAIVEADAIGQALYVVRRGSVRVVRGGVPIGTLGAGEVFGEMSLVDDLFTSARVEAEGDVELIAIPRAPFEALLASDPAFAAKVYRTFCRALSERLRRTNDLLPSAERLAHGVR